MKKLNVALIGAGQLGSRHLQGLIQSKLAINVIVIDTSVESILVCKGRVTEIGGINTYQNISYHNSLDSLKGKEIELAIIATSASGRLDIIEELVSLTNVKKLILEKVVFQDVASFEKASTLLKQNEVKCWVNHPMRMYKSYQKLKALIENEEKVELFYQNNNWGLACNALHYLDCFLYITDSSPDDLNIDLTRLKHRIYASKRSGYIEVCGELNASGKRGTVYLNSSEENVDYLFEIRTSNYKITVNEYDNSIFLTRHGECATERMPYNAVHYQSEMTSILVTQLIKENDIELPTFQDARLLHTEFLNKLLTFINIVEDESFNYCNIT